MKNYSKNELVEALLEVQREDRAFRAARDQEALLIFIYVVCGFVLGVCFAGFTQLLLS